MRSLDPTEMRASLFRQYGRLFIDSIPMSCSLRKEDNSVVHCNQKTLELFGVGDVGELGAYLRDCAQLPQPDGEMMGAKARRAFDNAVKEDHSRLQMYVAHAKTGAPLWIETEIIRIPWSDNFRFICFSRDLGEEKQQEMLVRAAERRVRLMLDATPLAVSIIDGDSTMLDCNNTAVRMLKAPDKGYVMAHLLDELSAEVQPGGMSPVEKRAENLRAAIQNGIHKSPWLYRDFFGEAIPVDVTYVRIPKEHGGCYVVVYSSDQREFIKKEKAAREANEMLELMFNALNCGSCIWEEDLSLVDCNEQQVTLFRCRDKEELLKNFYDLSPKRQPDGEDSKEKAFRLIRNAFDTGSMDFSWEHRTMQGDAFPAEISLRRVKWRDGWRVVSSLRETGAVKKAEERNIQLEVENRAMRATAEMKSSFLASMSHEIRTPMNVVVGLADLIRTDNLDKKQREFIVNIRSMSHVLLQIINDILDYSKIEAGKFELVPNNYSFRYIFDHVVSLTRASIGDKLLEFHARMDDDVPAVLYGDDVRMRQILFNILNNAVKYTPYGSIDFHVGRMMFKGVDSLAITIKDTGIGIHKGDIPHLFERFVQFDSHKNHRITGTGLGLPICKDLVELMSGEIAVDSEYGKGTEVSIHLPIVEGDISKVNHAQSSLPRVMGTPDARVLVVDDNELNLAVALGYLAHHGIQAETAASGAEAIQKIAAEPWDLVFMDHMMPNMDGIEATRHIRAMQGGRFRDLPIIAFSANAIVGMRETFLAGGLNDFVGKPIDPDELNNALKRWLPPSKQVPDAAGAHPAPPPPTRAPRAA
ncbi:MAG: response regulator [Acidobacteriota bacterium]|jgi:signal transduction histidine kinase/ActR/RegA family two-component response regulator|nr:response regulator [Acidobacteriota bacterium]